jgi:hypothetical protein
MTTRFSQFSPPLSNKTSVYLNLPGVLTVLNTLTGSASENWYALKQEVDTVGVLPTIVTALSNELISFTQPDTQSPTKAPVDDVKAIVSTNGKNPEVLGTTASIPFAEAFIKRHITGSRITGYNRGSLYTHVDDEGKEVVYRVVHHVCEHGVISALFKDPEPKNVVEPSSEPTDGCGFNADDVCDDDSDSDLDSCEPIQKKCTSNFRPAH